MPCTGASKCASGRRTTHPTGRTLSQTTCVTIAAVPTSLPLFTPGRPALRLDAAAAVGAWGMLSASRERDAPRCALPCRWSSTELMPRGGAAGRGCSGSLSRGVRVASCVTTSPGPRPSPRAARRGRPGPRRVLSADRAVACVACDRASFLRARRNAKAPRHSHAARMRAAGRACAPRARAAPAAPRGAADTHDTRTPAAALTNAPGDPCARARRSAAGWRSRRAVPGAAGGAGAAGS